MRTARLGDKTLGTCFCHKSKKKVPGEIITASTTMTIDGKGVAREGDLVRATCGHTGTIVLYSTTMTADGRGVARKGDETVGCYKAKIIVASDTTSTDKGD